MREALALSKLTRYVLESGSSLLTGLLLLAWPVLKAPLITQTTRLLLSGLALQAWLALLAGLIAQPGLLRSWSTKARLPLRILHAETALLHDDVAANTLHDMHALHEATIARHLLC